MQKDIQTTNEKPGPSTSELNPHSKGSIPKQNTPRSGSPGEQGQVRMDL